MQEPTNNPAADAISEDEQRLSNLQADFERIAHQMYTQNLALVQTNTTLSILRAIDLLTLESSRDLPNLSADISKAIIDTSDYAMVGVFSLNQYGDTYLRYQGSAVSSLPNSPNGGNGIEPLLQRLNVPLDDKWVHSGSRNLIVNIADKQQMAKAEIFNTGAIDQLAPLGQAIGMRSLYFTKLKARDNLTGVMMVGLADPIPMIDDIELIERVSEPTGIAIDNRLLYEENTRVVRQLQQTNDRLKEMDAAKDEFISMASHQLRTPLTSMKGYVSMVLDGDAGEISDMQRSLLKQAYDSSQRMVYLIADLLNVSRLRTGKFIITDKATDLSQVVQDELNQLSNAAIARNVRFVYNKPANFPLLLLDETKIRQVVMNFLDNALYYTPSGGQVTVELTADAKSVRYTVTDTGLGVSKEDQKYLFTKFYRAQNARKMRPDGTGLGLYMARKVVVAQGGAILFNSVEGQGSTFGFSFPVSKIVAQEPKSNNTPEQIQVPH